MHGGHFVKSKVFPLCKIIELNDKRTFCHPYVMSEYQAGLNFFQDVEYISLGSMREHKNEEYDGHKRLWGSIP